MRAYDYVIVGAGSAGCVLADRLSADASATVCVHEAGPLDKNPLIRVPIGLIWMMMSKTLNWQYECIDSHDRGEGGGHHSR